MKTAEKSAELVVQSHGGALLRGGVHGNKGGSGRPPHLLRNWCDRLLTRDATKRQVEAILRDKDHPAFVQMWKAVAERAYGKPQLPIALEGSPKIAFLFAAEGRRFHAHEEAR